MVNSKYDGSHPFVYNSDKHTNAWAGNLTVYQNQRNPSSLHNDVRWCNSLCIKFISDVTMKVTNTNTHAIKGAQEVHAGLCPFHWRSASTIPHRILQLMRLDVFSHASETTRNRAKSCSSSHSSFFPEKNKKNKKKVQKQRYDSSIHELACTRSRRKYMILKFTVTIRLVHRRNTFVVGGWSSLRILRSQVTRRHETYQGSWPRAQDHTICGLVRSEGQLKMYVVNKLTAGYGIAVVKLLWCGHMALAFHRDYQSDDPVGCTHARREYVSYVGWGKWLNIRTNRGRENWVYCWLPPLTRSCIHCLTWWAVRTGLNTLEWPQSGAV